MYTVLKGQFFSCNGIVSVDILAMSEHVVLTVMFYFLLAMKFLSFFFLMIQF